MRLVLVDRGRDACDAMKWHFREFPEVEVVCGRFEDLPAFDCILTAGNSFGLMDAGIDLAVVKFFGRQIMEAVQKRILADFLGEQPVGTSIIVPTNDTRHPYVAHAPTMRVPANINGTDNVYLALWATLTAIRRFHRDHPNERAINTLACPALGTGTGGVPVMEAALQLNLAYRHYRNPPEHLNGTFAQRRHEAVHYGARRGFQHPREEVL